MSRRSVLLGVLLVLAIPETVSAKGGGIEMVVPGERVTFQSDVLVDSSTAAAELVGVPHFAHLERWRTTRIVDPILVGRVELHHLDPDHRFLRYRVSIEVPNLTPGRYVVVLCDSGCRNILGGTSVGSPLQVVASRVERRLRLLMKLRVQELQSRVATLSDSASFTNEIRDIRLRYVTSRALELARRVEDLEDRRIPTTKPSWAASLWLLVLGSAIGIGMSAAFGRVRRRTMSWGTTSIP